MHLINMYYYYYCCTAEILIKEVCLADGSSEGPSLKRKRQRPISRTI